VPIRNVVDHRANKYKTKNLYIVLEPSAHDNSIPNADQYEFPESSEDAFNVKEFDNTNMDEVIRFAQTLPFAITMFIYDNS
jgi:hypothetical protein